MNIMDFFRFGPICVLVVYLQTALAMPQPQQRFLPNFNTNDGATQLAGLGSLGVGAFALGNVLSGNDNVRLSPQFGANFDPNSGAISPTLGLNAQVGDGPVAPSFGVGGQFNTQNGQLQPFGTGVNIGGLSNGFNPNAGGGVRRPVPFLFGRR